MKPPTNTAKQADENPASVLVSAMALGSSGAIEAQEAQGQRELVASEVLPVEISHRNGRAILEGYGVKFLAIVEGDELFQQVELPAGWHKEATDHAMWSKLLDDKGRERASIFYKAAFYDRCALMHLTRRFSVERDYDREDVAVGQVKDCGKVIFETPPIKVEPTKSWEASDAARDAATAWLVERYTDWENYAAYWD